MINKHLASLFLLLVSVLSVNAQELKFSISFSDHLRSSIDGRILLLISNNDSAEPCQIAE